MKLLWPDTFVEEANLSQNIFVLRKALGETAQEACYIGSKVRFDVTSAGIAPGAKDTLPRNWLPNLGRVLVRDLELALEPREDHASYIATWLKALAADNRAVFTAAAQAQRGAEFINRRVAEAAA